MYHKDGGDGDMSYLLQPRGKGWVFRMETPKSLVGTPNPWTGRPFGREIKKGLGTRLKREAMRQRDLVLGQVRELEASARRGQHFAAEAAERWRQALLDHDKTASGDPDECNPRDVLLDMVERDERLPKGRRNSTQQELEAFAAVAVRSELLLADALPRYLRERGEDARLQGYAVLRPSTRQDVKAAVAYLLEHEGPSLTLTDVDHEKARRHLQDHLPQRKSPRAPQGMSRKTVEKHQTLLVGLWNWAIERGLLDRNSDNPWVLKRTVRLAKDTVQGREDFSGEEVVKLLAACPRGGRMGDAMRLALVTGCRSDELGQVRLTDLDGDGRGFRIREGKTENAARWLPLPEVVQELVSARLAASPSNADGRLFWDWPVRPSNGKCAALPQAFTRVRREVLGVGTDGRLAFHSFRHTWRTRALRAELNDHLTNALGGWKGEKSSSSPYAHGFEDEALRAAQEKIAERMKVAGYLVGL
ncbi:Site-specific recombinase XerD [Albimonas donghaensis]|uniref:Site-specific recombinase XerD n=1 Tax=Albimonas donghaensis TaxID=356660 RepID=A0A1H3G940_9RHOB|nr:tyrosine-type recombinase/integrase [Albimonas donghaensis]SDX99842.1 Site-specific recombinase XerD [Albimonas donghaensis]